MNYVPEFDNPEGRAQWLHWRDRLYENIAIAYQSHPADLARGAEAKELGSGALSGLPEATLRVLEAVESDPEELVRYAYAIDRGAQQTIMDLLKSQWLESHQ